MTLEDLFEQHHAGLFRFISRLTNDPDFAKDIVQETFLSIAGKPVPTSVPPRVWLFQRASNLARSGMRKRNRRLTLLRNGAHGVPVASPAVAPDVGAERMEARAAVRHALTGLNDRERTILLMREEGFTHREIADAVGTTTGSIGTMYARALMKLENRLGDAWREGP